MLCRQSDLNRVSQQGLACSFLQLILHVRPQTHTVSVVSIATEDVEMQQYHFALQLGFLCSQQKGELKENRGCFNWGVTGSEGESLLDYLTCDRGVR